VHPDLAAHGFRKEGIHPGVCPPSSCLASCSSA
jgi:hypothetical protein